MPKKKKRPDDPRWNVIAICAVLVGLVWLVFGQTLGYDFVQYDDDPYVYNNAVLKGGITLRGLQRAFTHTHASNGIRLRRSLTCWPASFSV
jgi:hypothetical protein